MSEKKLIELEPKWIGEPAIGIQFICPDKCGSRVRVYWESPKPPYEPKDTVWDKSGDTFENLTLSPSIDATPGCTFHGWLKKGIVSW